MQLGPRAVRPAQSGAADVGPRPPRLSRPVRLRRPRASGSVFSWRAASASC
ncbi:hypothetical protein HMPREF1979_03348 [Actinomyces johnsonii F0542]|uniref:Uncharacterized protein n=1 Tax=Actinomyces johnsonii F0542 TaxID=1321818 RepID=U1RL84_9ACTO|nr:hypothetical protein HMPREF1979_03348 [Actinomyces johnsonii F0542]